MRRWGLFRKMLLSYMLVAIVPFCCLIIMLVYRVNDYGVKTGEARILADLSRVQEILDVHCTEMKSIAYQLSESTILFSPNEDQSKRVEAISNLKTYQISNHFLQTIALWHKADNSVYTTSGLMSKTVYLKMFPGIENDAMNMQKRIREAEGAFVCSCSGSNNLLYFVPCRETITGEITAIFSFDADTIIKMLPDYNTGSNTYFMLLDQQNHIIYQNLPDQLDVDHIYSGNIIRIANKNMRVFRSNIGQVLMPVVFISNDFFITPFSEIIPIVFIAFCVLLVIVGLSAWFASVSMKPINRLSTVIGRGEKKYNSWDNLHKDISMIIRGNEEYMEQILTQKQLLREHYLRHLLFSYMPVVSETGLMAPEEAWMKGEQFCVAGFHIAKGIWEITIDKIRQFLAPEDGCIPLESEGIYVVVFSFQNQVSMDEIKKQCELLLNDLENDVTIGLGSIVNTKDQLRMSYLQAIVALQKADAGQGKRLITFEDVLQVQNSYSIPKENEIYFSLALDQGDQQLAFKMLNEMLLGLEEAPRARVHYTLYVIMDSILPFLSRDGYEEEAEKTGRAMMSEIESLHIELFRQLAEKSIQVICKDRIDKHEKAKTDDNLRMDVLMLVHQNYTDHEMSLDYLSNHLGYSNSYWSRFFTEIIGVSFSDYLWELRVKRAKQLLKTHLSVAEVVDKIGYVDVRSFTRKLKNAEGITPAQYKKNSNSDHEQEISEQEE